MSALEKNFNPVFWHVEHAKAGVYTANYSVIASDGHLYALVANPEIDPAAGTANWIRVTGSAPNFPAVGAAASATQAVRGDDPRLVSTPAAIEIQSRPDADLTTVPTAANGVMTVISTHPNGTTVHWTRTDDATPFTVSHTSLSGDGNPDVLPAITERAVSTRGIDPTAAELNNVTPKDNDHVRVILPDGTIELHEYLAGAWSVISTIEPAPIDVYQHENIRTYVAIPGANDIANINAIIDDLNSGDNGGTIWLPSHEYSGTGFIHIKNGINLIGSGSGRVTAAWSYGTRVTSDTSPVVFVDSGASSVQRLNLNTTYTPATTNEVDAAVVLHFRGARESYASQIYCSAPNAAGGGGAINNSIGLYVEGGGGYGCFVNKFEKISTPSLTTGILVFGNSDGAPERRANGNKFVDCQVDSCDVGIELRNSDTVFIRGLHSETVSNTAIKITNNSVRTFINQWYFESSSAIALDTSGAATGPSGLVIVSNSRGLLINGSNVIDPGLRCVLDGSVYADAQGTVPHSTAFLALLPPATNYRPGIQLRFHNTSGGLDDLTGSTWEAIDRDRVSDVAWIEIPRREIEQDGGSSVDVDFTHHKLISKNLTNALNGSTLNFLLPPIPGPGYFVHLKQLGAGNRDVVWPANVIGTPPPANQASNSSTIYQFYFDGTNFHYIG